MTRRARVLLLGTALAGVVAVAACGKGREDAPSTPSAAAPSASATTVPLDQLAPGELLEGSEEAFGLKLPRGLVVEHRYPGTVYASGPFTVHSLVEYFRPRLRDGSLREGKESATFQRVHVPGQPGLEAEVRIRIELGTTRVEIANIPPPPNPNLPDEAARWRTVGLQPGGKVLDPTHLE